MEYPHLNNPATLVLATLAYSFLVTTTTPKNAIFLRLILLLPTIYIFCIFPWFLSSAFFRGLASLFVTWLASFKLLHLCFNGDSLISSNNYIDFVATSIFPFQVRAKSSPPAHGSFSANLLNFSLLFILMGLFCSSFPTGSFYIKILLYAITLSGLVGPMARYEFVEIMDHPYLSKSLVEFWGKRWNKSASNILRMTIYDPAKTLLSNFAPKKAKSIAKITTLAISGVMHELMFYYITCGKKPEWEMTWFFVLQGLSMAVESGLIHFWTRSKKWNPVHPFVAVLATQTFVLGTSYWFLVLPILKSGQDDCKFRPSWFFTFTK